MNHSDACMPSGSRAWCNESMRTSGSFSSIAALSETLSIQIARPSTVVPRLAFAVVNVGYAAWIWSSTDCTCAYV
jgi:hypothetical protein